MFMNFMIFKGVVKRHLGRGKQLGYPTANIEISADTEKGVFIGYTQISKNYHSTDYGTFRKLPSIIFIGAPEMFGETDKRLETHILDFESDLYGQEIVVEIIHKLRDNRKFESEEALIAQMKVDEREARKFFSE